MSSSLNRAFIKAYSKDKATGSVTEGVPEKPDADSDRLLVRVDTTSVPIPAPHLSRPRTDAEPVLTSQVASPPSQASVATPVEGPTGLDTPSHVDQSLRDSIASQMISAGGIWEDQQIDTFMGGFPAVNVKPTERSELPPTSPKISASAGEIEREKTDREIADPEVDRSIPESPVNLGQESTSGTSGSDSKHADDLPAAAVPETPATASDLAAPESPALTFDEMEKAVQNYANERSSRGEIFRLDRPSYTSADEQIDEQASDASSDQSNSVSETNFDLQEVGNAVRSLSNATIDIHEHESETAIHGHDGQPGRAVEEGLRNAKLRIFNPVWEVDSLQWPEVCIELLEQTADSMHRVATNLMTACQEGLQVLAVTSPQSGEGRTTVACCLAILAGSHGLRVAIVDGDIENPTLSLQTNLDVENDWKSAIQNQVPIEEVAIHSIDDQVTLLPLIRPIDQREMSSDDNRIAFMLHELSESFDLVIVDMGHMDSTRSLVTSMGEQGIISAAVTVVDHRTSSPQRIEACIRRIRRTGIASIGIVENFAA